MRGSIKWQVREVFKAITAIGQSKHALKERARQAGAKTWHQLGKNLGVHSYKTLDAYRDVARQLMKYVKSEHGLKDIEKLTGEHVRSFLEHKISQGVSYSTFQQYASALEKLEVALNKYAELKGKDNRYDFEQGIRSAREVARETLERSNNARAYSDPDRLIKSLSKPEHRLAANIQLEGGARLHETSLIKPGQLKGVGFDPYTSKEAALIEVRGKGGYVRELRVSLVTYRALESYIKQRGFFRVDKDEYREALRRAAEGTGQAYKGSHGLRWNFAQRRMVELQSAGLTYEHALKVVSKEMGHHRADITEHYLQAE